MSSKEETNQNIDSHAQGIINAAQLVNLPVTIHP